MSGFTPKGCAPRRLCAKRAGPVYPLIKTPVLAGGTYYIQFTLQVSPTVILNAYLVTSTASVGAPVIVQTDSIAPACPAPITTAVVMDIMTQTGNPLSNPGPVIFKVYNAIQAGPNSTAIVGNVVDPTTGTLLYSSPAAIDYTTYTHNELYLQSFVAPKTTILITSNTSAVTSYSTPALILCAVPSATVANQFLLKYTPETAPQGYVVSAINLLSTLPCAPCNIGSQPKHHSSCKCCTTGEATGVTPL